jgi:uncharacterized protein (TIGR02594 family)
MEFEIIFNPGLDYSRFFGISSKKPSREIDQLFTEIDLGVIGTMSIGNNFSRPNKSTIQQNSNSNINWSMQDIFNLFHYVSDSGSLHKHYLHFGARTLELSKNHCNWSIDWNSISIPKWLRIAKNELGIKEFKISDYIESLPLYERMVYEFEANINNNQLQYNKHNSKKYFLFRNGEISPDKFINNPEITKYANAIIDDEVPWCSYFAQWVMKQSGIKGPTKKPGLALSWINWGQALDQPIFGSIVIFRHRNGTGHIGFVIGQTRNRLIVLGGNQSDKVSIKEFSTKEIVKHVYPPSAIMNPFQNYLTEVHTDGINTKDR